MKRRTLTSIIAIMLSASSLITVQAYAKPKVLSSVVEAKWIQAVKNHRTRDGATVSEVLAYAQKMRPRQFRAGSFDVGYNGATGQAETVAIAYWIGAKRAPEDAYVDLCYPMSSNGQLLPVPADEALATALEGGRDAFLRAIDEAYRNDCISDPDGSVC